MNMMASGDYRNVIYRDEDVKSSQKFPVGVIVHVSEVPKFMSFVKPEAFSPQLVGLSPYHHFRSELIVTKEMKLKAFCRVLMDIDGPQRQKRYNFLEGSWREQSYSRHLGDFYSPRVFSGSTGYNTVYCAVACDSLFLLGLLHSHRGFSVNPEGLITFFLTGRTGVPRINDAGQELTMEAVIGDVFMIENQIPTFFLRLFLLKIQGDQEKDCDVLIGSLMQGFCEAASPLIHHEKLSHKSYQHRHLLDLLLHLISPDPESEPDFYPTCRQLLDQEIVNVNEKCREWRERLSLRDSEIRLTFCDETETQTQQPEQSDGELHANNNNKSYKQSKDGTHLNNNSNWFFKVCSAFGLFVGSVVLLIATPFLWAFSMLQTVLRPLPYLLVIVKAMLKEVHELLSKYEAQFPWLRRYTTSVTQLKLVTEAFQLDSSTNLGQFSRPLSATELQKGGIHLKPAQPGRGGISSVEFDEENSQFYLPQMKLGVNSEVIIRNLMAYELLTKSEGLIFTRYIQLMKGLLATSGDVSLLIREKIIHTELIEKFVNQLFKEISEPIRPTKAPKLEEMIKRINAKFEDSQKLKRFMDKYVASGTIFKALGVIVFLVLTALQTYCSVFDCSRT